MSPTSPSDPSLVERLRALAPLFGHKWNAATILLSADRIEALEARNRELEAELRLPDAERRQHYISECLAATGVINRIDITSAFYVSVPQASADIKKWLSCNPGAAIYNKSSKRYERALLPSPTGDRK